MTRAAGRSAAGRIRIGWTSNRQPGLLELLAGQELDGHPVDAHAFHRRGEDVRPGDGVGAAGAGPHQRVDVLVLDGDRGEGA